MTPKDVRKIRGDLSRAVFAMMLGISEVTLWRWEVGDAKPEGGSLRILELIGRDRKSTLAILSRFLQESLQKES